MKENTNILTLLTPKVKLAYLDDSMSVRQALEKMKAHGFSSIPLIREKTGEYLGSISEGDLLWFITSMKTYDIHECEGIPVASLLRRDYIPAVKVNTKIEDLLRMVMGQNFVPIVDDRNILMGIVTRRSVIYSLLQRA